MRRFVEGTYLTPETAMMAVEQLTAQGYSKADMTFVTNSTSARNIADNPGVRIMAHDFVDDEDDESWWDGIRDFFSKRRDTVNPGEIIDNDEVLSQYKDRIQRGEIVLLVEEGGTRVPEEAGFAHQLEENTSDTGDRVIPVAAAGAGVGVNGTNNPNPMDRGVLPYIPDLDRTDNDQDLKR